MSGGPCYIITIRTDLGAPKVTQIRVNLLSQVNAAKVRKETRNDRDILVIPGAVAKFNSILNRILYTEESLTSTYEGLNRTPAPLGHPMIGNSYASARDPEAINRNYIGAWNENARIDGDRILADTVVDTEFAKRHPEGKRLLDTINKGEPISTSTGLYLELEEAPEDAEYDFIARNIVWDHVAILLDETPAIGTKEGVGLLVNRKQVDVVNSSFDDDDIHNALTYAIEAMERKERREKNTGVVSQVAAFIQKLLGAQQDDPAAVTNVESGDPSMNLEEQVKTLTEQMAELQGNTKAAADAVTALSAKLEAIEAETKAAAEAEHAAAVEAVVNAKLMDEADAKGLPVTALNAVLKAGKKAAPLIPGMYTNWAADDKAYDTLPE